MKFQQRNNNSFLIFDSEIVNTSQNHNEKAKTEEYINYLSPFLYRLPPLTNVFTTMRTASDRVDALFDTRETEEE